MFSSQETERKIIYTLQVDFFWGKEMEMILTRTNEKEIYFSDKENNLLLFHLTCHFFHQRDNGRNKIYMALKMLGTKLIQLKGYGPN